ncbi:MAG TPA: rhodanese-like domain-containing protein [Burkholderiales bacterium]|nr:rhodanese-like domain-containing protein [Burkholderiales bacterium]
MSADAAGNALISAQELASLLRGRSELALLDVREAGQFGERHIFFAVPLPYSRLELEIDRLVPRRDVLVVLCDERDGVALRAQSRLRGAGYTQVKVLDRGMEGWHAAGFKTFRGVNVPSKAFGELVERSHATPHITPDALNRLLTSSPREVVIVDGRPLDEFRRMHIPGAICCPNGELALRIREIVRDEKTTIVVNCAGRTRSILGAQTLLNCGLRNPIYALENGTQGWFLSGYELVRGHQGALPRLPHAGDVATLRASLTKLAWWRDVPRVSARQLSEWYRDAGRTTYLFDVRTREEYDERTLPGAMHTPGGQLLQATDQWVGIRGARIVLFDANDVRAVPVAYWLRQMGHTAYVLEGGVGAAIIEAPAAQRCVIPGVPCIDYSECGSMRLIDLRPSMEYRRGHAPGAIWSTRARIRSATSDVGNVGLIVNDRRIAALAAIDLRECGVEPFHVLNAPVTEASPYMPADSDCIDFLFFASTRHDGDAEAARQYLAWETALIGQLGPAELETFNVAVDVS